MNLYLDSKDLINVLQKDTPCPVDHLEEILHRGGHKLAVSFYTVYEISVPLLRATSKTNVMALLNRLERMPITFVRSDVDSLELTEAVAAYSSKRDYRTINVFVDRFDKAVDFHARPSTGIFMNYSLGETIWDLSYHGELKGLESYAHQMRKIVAADRLLKKPISLKANFVKTIERHMKLHNLSCPDVVLSDFASWIYENPKRCPAIRLIYEVSHKIVKNKTDILEDSDMEDHQHLTCLPYVDLMTLDKRMHGYASQAFACWDLDYPLRILKSTQDMLNRLGPPPD